MGKMNSILENLVISQQTQGRFPAQPQQNPKPANCIEETHEQIQAITTLRSGKEIDKTIAPKRVIQVGEESRDLGGESERQKVKEERKESKGKEREHDSESSVKMSNEITVEDLKHAPFPHRLAKVCKANLNAEIYDVFKNLHVKETAMMNESQSAILQCRPFLATMNVVIHYRHGLLKLSFRNMTLETNIFTMGKQMREVKQLEETYVIESIIQEHVDREFMEDSIERALVWSEPHDQLESKSISFRDASIVCEESDSVMHDDSKATPMKTGGSKSSATTNTGPGTQSSGPTTRSKAKAAVETLAPTSLLPKSTPVFGSNLPKTSTIFPNLQEGKGETTTLEAKDAAAMLEEAFSKPSVPQKSSSKSRYDDKEIEDSASSDPSSSSNTL
ncbi:hypothetical protein Acr_24g0006090 [Actinidia rufa]|uniref:Uncharacterized protein n=1 Tax=Actinidia rufa TaxID=165716 RepID=A0A7J0GUB0_9ERIC|nr:hypothetical protein Acr_24g0006090 [Actinidia rufa]